MLYHVYETNHMLAKPWRAAVKSFSYFVDHKKNSPFDSVPGRYLASACDLFLSLTERYDKPDWHIDSTNINGISVPVSIETVWKDNFCHLLHFKRDRAARKRAQGRDRPDPRVLIVAPLSGHYATLLRGTVEAMLPEHEVFITDWIDAREVPVTQGTWDLNDYIDDVISCLQRVGPRAHVLAICQPGPAVIAAVSYMTAHESPDLPASMTIVGSPIDTRESPTDPNRIAQQRPLSWFKHNVVHRVPPPNPGALRRVYPGFLQLSGFINMKRSQHVKAHMKYFKNLIEGDGDSVQKHREFYREYLSVLDLPAEFYLQTIRDVFQQHKLPKGEFTHRGEIIEPAFIREVALFTIEAEHDDVSGIGQTQAAHKLCSGIPEDMKFDYVQPGVGHYGVFNGKRFRNEVQPRMRDFIRSHFDVREEQKILNSLNWS